MTRGKPLSFDRNTVLERAMQLFWRRGYTKTGMTDLLEHMGIQRQSFYNTFGSKEEIFLEAVKLYAHSRFSEISAILAGPGNPIENIKKVLGIWRKMVIGEETCGCMLGNSVAELGLEHAAVGKLLEENISLLVDAFQRALSKAQAQGYLARDKDPHALANAIVVIAQGMALMSKLDYGRVMVDDVVKAVEDLIEA